MATETNRSLTILQVKDHLGDALKGNLKLFDKLSDTDSRFHKQMDANLGKLNANWKMVGTIGKAAFAGIAVAAGAFFAGAIRKAEEFNSEFRQLANLNLDKSDTQLKALENQVLKTATATGRLGADTSKAFFDIQSGTGMYGEAVDQVVRKTSDFSRAYKVDFNTAVEGAVKGVRNFGLQAGDMDEYFGSMVKTVQVGITTFEQLARVQTDYAGAANTAGQSVDSANKLFAVFTTKAKSAEEAATLTKSAFTDLLKPATLEAFDKIGVKVFDQQTGKVKQLDEIVSQLNNKFAGMRGNDQAVTSLVNEFKGSEGLIALIGEAAKNGDNMLETFRQFDQTPFQMGKALNLAKMDTAEMAEIARNRLDTIMARIGNTVLPLWVSLLGKVNDEILPGIEKRMPSIETVLNRMVDAIGKTIKDIGAGLDWVGRQYEKLDRLGAKVDPMRRGQIKEDLIAKGIDPELVKGLSGGERFDLQKAMPNLYDDAAKFQIEAARQLADKFSQEGGSDAAKAFAATLRQRIANEQAGALINKAGLGGSASSDTPTPATIGASGSGGGTPATSGGSGKAGGGLREGLRAVVASERMVRNVTVNIQKIVGIETLSTTRIEESRRQLEDAIRETLIKAIRDSEVGISNSL